MLRFACLTYTDGDGPARWERARALLEADPSLAHANVHIAAACANAAALREKLSADRSLARKESGPFGWEPLMYLAYARHDLTASESRLVDSVRILVEHGADPNVGYLWHGLPSPFTALTGAFGEGELGPRLQPRHPHSLELARVLLEAGAEANDSQALYNRMFGDDDDHLVLLFEFGLGTGDGGPWRARLGDAIDLPEALLRAQLRWAVMHDQRSRVRLLLEHGVDPDTTFPDGRSAVEAAEMSGHREISELLTERGATDARLDPVAAFIAAVFADDPAALAVRSRGRDPGEGGAAGPARLGCGAGQPRRRSATLVALGFDVDAKARADVPIEQEWETALHAAVANGDAQLVVQLLAWGADPTIRDTRFDATPLGWARHGGHTELIDVLGGVTPDDS